MSKNEFETISYSVPNNFGTLHLITSNMVEGFLQENKVLSIHKSYYVYCEETGLWKKYEDEEIKREIFAMLSEEEKQAWSPKVKSSVMEFLSVRTKTLESIPQKKGNWFCLQNCVVNLDTGKVRKFSSDFFFTGKSTYNFVKGATCPTFLKYLETVSCGNESLIKTLIEVLGYCLSATTKAHVAFCLTGDGCNGKSVFLDVISELAGRHYYISFKPGELEKSFSRSALEGKRVLLMPDLEKKESEFLMTAEMKKIIAGDLISAEIKYGGTITFRSHLKVIISSNFLPSFIHDNTYGARRRLIVLPFNKHISEKEKDKELFGKLKKELSGIFLLALDGYKRLKENDFKFSYTGEEIIQEKQKQAYPLSAFVSECVETNPASFVRYRTLGSSFSEWCKRNNVQTMLPNSKEFFGSIKEQHFNATSQKRGGYRGILGIALKKM